MDEVAAAEFRERFDEVLERVAAGEHLIVTRDGRPIAELRPFPRPRLRAEEVLQRWSRLPDVDPQALRQDIDRVVGATL